MCKLLTTIWNIKSVTLIKQLQLRHLVSQSSKVSGIFYANMLSDSSHCKTVFASIGKYKYRKTWQSVFRFYKLATFLPVIANGPPSFLIVNNKIKTNFEDITKLQVDSTDCTSPLAVNSIMYLPYILRHPGLLI